MRDIDMYMFYDSDRDEYYCIRCQFRGNEEAVLAKNEEIRLKYRDIYRRFTFEEFEDFSNG